MNPPPDSTFSLSPTELDSMLIFGGFKLCNCFGFGLLSLLLLVLSFVDAVGSCFQWKTPLINPQYQESRKGYQLAGETWSEAFSH